MLSCSHYIVPELGPSVKFSYASHKAVTEYKEAKAVSSFCLLLICYILSDFMEHNQLFSALH